MYLFIAEQVKYLDQIPKSVWRFSHPTLRVEFEDMASKRGLLIYSLFYFFLVIENIQCGDICDSCTFAVLRYCCRIQNKCCAHVGE